MNNDTKPVHEVNPQNVVWGERTHRPEDLCRLFGRTISPKRPIQPQGSVFVYTK